VAGVLWYGWQITVQGRAGLESIEDLGPPASIDAQRGFGLSREDLLEGGSAEVRSARKRKDSMGQVYYEWCVHALPSLPTSPTAAGAPSLLLAQLCSYVHGRGHVRPSP
jgi:hypothetical protein